MHTRQTTVALCACLLAINACGSGSKTAGKTAGTGASTTPSDPHGTASAGAPITIGPEASYAPTINPASFTDKITNPYYPLQPSTSVFEGTSDGKPTRDEFVVTTDRKTILGVSCVVVHDSAFVDNKLEEETFDWFAQDADGNVWYFGEATRTLDETGKVLGTTGSFEAGVNGAHPGIIMPAKPAVGVSYREEYAKGVAQDIGKVIGAGTSTNVKAGSYHDVIVIEDSNPLDGTTEHKLFAPGVGFVSGDMTKGGSEHTELVRIEPH